MLNPNLPEPNLLKTLLEPLLEDFQYWFARSRKLLENEEISFLGKEGQTELLARVQYAQQEVTTAQMLLRATEGQVGVEMEVLMPWHKLLTECWQVSMRFRMENSV
ncbi:DUF2605 domain-containing protein [Laspinema sp. D1]|jgi:hypothetical protein|uniref:DUF2605 domain-containing protein n=2 Tax=Laspinema TaxID=2584823 RepID=A0ABT2MR45_9CYAN|nr:MULTISPECIES: DUF2605 domain-containing protein [unclassified Laspinema]MCT7964439.1 DUF2605 domain-containing protein [Laspinema sp. D2b]MCT7967173.1 DUF2605 domain-containing protein [Laspinema sp. D2a]MCT7973242.1 DUF2605 domain-containing protein [Laspinema sp. D3d]MCT7978786.1 DUF2605 domain-containing protein [Laspinema sp. D3b]MCT7984439.1 DUF2605 domain-containing protein [Laspinema sp. D2d]